MEQHEIASRARAYVVPAVLGSMGRYLMPSLQPVGLEYLYFALALFGW